jgi:hypothetical protein
MGRSHELARLGALADFIDAALFDDAKIEDFDDLFAVIGASEEDIAGLEVAVDVPGLVEAPEAPGDLVGDADDLVEGDGAGGSDAFEEVFAFEELHDEVGDAVLEPAIFDVDEVSVANSRGGPGLALEAGEGGPVGEEGGVEEFNGDLRAELDVLGDPDRALAPGREAAAEAVFAADD